MMRFVAFIRGINVGGRSVKKEKLQETFTFLGFQKVTTHKQSGNVIFENESENIEEIEKKIEIQLQQSLGYNVSVFIRTISQLKAIVENEPFKEINGKESTDFLCTFLKCAPAKFPFELPTTIPKSTAIIISAKDKEVFSETHGGGEGALPNSFIELKLKVRATTRNMNIIREIVEKYSA